MRPAWRDVVGLTGSVAALLALSACDEPGPLSAAARGRLPPAPEPSAWAQALEDKAFASAFPAKMRCEGSVDLLADRYAGARAIIGWGWISDPGRPVEYVVVVDEAGKMVGFGAGGQRRPDVPGALPAVASPNTGWTAVAPAEPRRRVQVYGVDRPSKAACGLGEIQIRP